MVKPVAAFHAARTSGFSGSPALTQCRNDANRYWDKSSLTISRSAVGGAHQVVIGYCDRVRRAAAGSNFPRASTAKTQAPICHGPNKQDHAALAQPVSVMHQWIASGL